MRVKLDWERLLGLRVVAAEASVVGRDAIGAKVGGKIGDKIGGKLGLKLGVKHR